MDFSVFLFVLLSLPVLLHGQALGCENSDPKTLEFLFMTSFSDSINTSGNAVGMKIALDKINADRTILPDYNLSYTAIVDTQCNRSTSLSEFFNFIQDPCRRFIAVIGSGCTVATRPVAEILHYWGLSQISYVSNSAEFRFTNDYPQYIQLYPSEVNFAPGIVSGIVYFGFKQVVLLTQTESIFLTNQELITGYLQSVNVTVLETPVIPSSETNISNIPDLFPQDGHIFFINAYEDKARQILCQAYRRGLYGPNYLWLVFGWYGIEWWRKADEFVSCTVEEMDIAINRALSIQQLPINHNESEVVVGNTTFKEYLDEYNEKSVAYSYNNVTTSHIAYDAVWTLALALDKVDRMIKNGDDLGECADAAINDTLGKWSYSRNTTTSCLVYQTLLNTNFSGLSGVVAFDSNGTRLLVPVRLSQYRDGKLVLVALSAGLLYLEYFEGESDDTLFPDGIPPDGTPIVTITTYHAALISIVYILAIIGLCFSGVCLVFIIYFRNNKVINLGTNVLNYCILLGIVLMLLALFFRVHNSTDSTVILSFCYISLWLLDVGYVIAFSGILTKMGRIYYVFFYPSKQKKINLTYVHLLSIVVVLSLSMGVILLVGSALPMTRFSVYRDNDLEHSPSVNERGVRQSFEYYRCYTSSSAVNIWFLSIFIYTAMLQISAIVLVLQTRNVKIKVLNDSKPVAAIVYVTSVVLVVMLIVILAFPSYQNLSESLFSLSLIVACYSMLFLIFVPKMVYVFKSTHSDEDISQSAQATVEVNKKGVLKITNDTETINLLYKQVDQLEIALETALKSKQQEIQQSDTYKVSISNNNTIIYNKDSLLSPSYTNGNTTTNNGNISNNNNGYDNTVETSCHYDDNDDDDDDDDDDKVYNRSTAALVSNGNDDLQHTESSTVV